MSLNISNIKAIESMGDATYVILDNEDTIILDPGVVNYINISIQKNGTVSADIDVMDNKEAY